MKVTLSNVQVVAVEITKDPRGSPDLFLPTWSWENAGEATPPRRRHGSGNTPRTRGNSRHPPGGGHCHLPPVLGTDVWEEVS